MMGAYESLFGDTEAFTTHMRGLQQMVRLRGGLGSLGVASVLERMLLWVDSNGSYATGFDVFFDETNFPSAFQHPTPNPSTFGVRTPTHTP